MIINIYVRFTVGIDLQHLTILIISIISSFMCVSFPIFHPQVLEGDYVFINALFGSEIRAVRLGKNKFHFGKESFYPQNYGIACTSGSPLKQVFDRM